MKTDVPVNKDVYEDRKHRNCEETFWRYLDWAILGFCGSRERGQKVPLFDISKTNGRMVMKFSQADKMLNPNVRCNIVVMQQILTSLLCHQLEKNLNFKNVKVFFFRTLFIAFLSARSF